MNPPPPHKPIIGLAGGIGCGKSLVAQQLQTLGCQIIDSDALARQAISDPLIHAQVLERWGADLESSPGRINRAALAQRVFGKSEELHLLEQMIHPFVHTQRAILREKIRNDPSACAVVEDCPLLFEKGLEAQVDVTLFVVADRLVQIKRLAEHRGWTEEELINREKNQLPLDMKAKRADYIVTNSGTKDECFDQVRRVLSQIIQRTI